MTTTHTSIARPEPEVYLIVLGKEPTSIAVSPTSPWLLLTSIRIGESQINAAYSSYVIPFFTSEFYRHWNIQWYTVRAQPTDHPFKQDSIRP